MIKYVQCVRRRPGMEVAEFRAHWEDYLRMARSFAGDLPLVRVSESTALLVEANVRIMQGRGTSEPFDAMLELWLETAGSLEAALGRPEVQEKLGRLQEKQEVFMDLEASVFFFAWENVRASQ